MTKKYIAKSIISVGVKLRSGATKHIAFEARANGGSVYYSGNAEEQHALESHPKYGRLYMLDKVVEKQNTEAAKPAEGKPAPKKENGRTEVRVTDLASAKDYLSDRFGISRTKLRYRKNIEDAAAEHNITFVGL